MKIITTAKFVAGIFARAADLEAYVSAAPTGLAYEILDVDVQFPFVLVETRSREFRPFQTADEALRIENIMAIYQIAQDYAPIPTFSDQMGSLDHTHPPEDEFE